jgi:hypothetical protein
MAMVPHERSLVNRLQDKPFALLGVAIEPSPEDLKDVQERRKIPWRSWWDGPHRIARKYQVSLYPHLLLIDHVGAIRKIYEGRPRDAELDHDIDQLIEEAEAAAKEHATQRTESSHDS